MTTIEAPPFSIPVHQRLAQMQLLIDQSGVTRSRERLEVALEDYQGALWAETTARGVERNAKEVYDTAVFNAEQTAEGSFETEGAKTWLLDGDGNRARTVTADTRRAWIANFVRLEMADQPATQAWRDADNNLAVTRDDVAVAAARLSITKRNLEAAVAVLNVLALAVPR